MKRREFVIAGLGCIGSVAHSEEASPEGASWLVVRRGNEVTLVAPAFTFRLDISDGLRALAWTNLRTGRTLDLGSGPEVDFDLGLPGHARSGQKLRITSAPPQGKSPGGLAIFKLAFEDGAEVTVSYRWTPQVPVLSKFVVIRNGSGEEWNRLLNVRLGTYQTNAGTEPPDPDYPVRVTKTPWADPNWIQLPDPAGRERGYPAYVEGQFFVGLAHPSGFALREQSRLSLRQHPGRRLAPGAQFTCMEAVFGVAAKGRARAAFRDYLATRMRRVLRGHDRPYALLSSFGGKPDGSFWEDEAYLQDNLEKVAQGEQEANLHWDYYSIDFWHDPQGDLKTPDTKRFPEGFDPILRRLRNLKTQPALWIDSGGFVENDLPVWTCGRNPALKDATTLGNGKGGLCRATEPANRFYIEGFTHQCRSNGVRMVTFDNCSWPQSFLDPTCNNPAHDHLPGVYSTEAIQEAIIECYRQLDQVCPDLFIKLFWGYRSPWWLLHADTLFDTGLRIEAASTAPFPALVARDSVTRSLDAARWMTRDLPWLGVDSLGIWLADWGWNNRQRKDHWQQGVIMDLCRGHLLPQLWTDTGYLSAPERRQMAEFIALVKARPDCFRNPRFILGNPWKHEPYGYSCTDGQRAFIAINNGTWETRKFALELSPAWGLPPRRNWDVYRWYPAPARLTSGPGEMQLELGPFEVVLLEAVPEGLPATLARKWNREPMLQRAAETARTVPLIVKMEGSRRSVLEGMAPATGRGGWFALCVELRKDNEPYLVLLNPQLLSATGRSGPAPFEPVLDVRGGFYPCCWQVWRAKLPPRQAEQPFELIVDSGLPDGVRCEWSGHFVPAG